MYVTFSLSVLFSLIILINVLIAQGLEEGNPCTVNDDSQGVCKFLTECPAALEMLEQGEFPENICGFRGTESVVCCHAVGALSPPTTRMTRPMARPAIKPTPKLRPKPTPKPTTTLLATRSSGDRSNEKCKEYAKYAFDLDPSPILTVEPQYPHTLVCPFEKIPLIVGGTLASRQEFPHMALLGSGSTEEWWCGGSLISERYILTAAHCLIHPEFGVVKHVRLGMTNLSDTNHMQEIVVSDVIPHPQYTSQSYHDIGLLRLERDVELNTYVRPACLQTQKHIPTTRVIASGWGKLKFLGKPSKDLLKVVLDFFSAEKCNATYTGSIKTPGSVLKTGIVEDLMICAGSHKIEEDTCQGDSGGPLQAYHEETDDTKCMYDIIGITSAGKHCGLVANRPGIYTRVSAYIKWIEDTVWP